MFLEAMTYWDGRVLRYHVKAVVVMWFHVMVWISESFRWKHGSLGVLRPASAEAAATCPCKNAKKWNGRSNIHLYIYIANGLIWISYVVQASLSVLFFGFWWTLRFFWFQCWIQERRAVSTSDNLIGNLRPREVLEFVQKHGRFSQDIKKARDVGADLDHEPWSQEVGSNWYCWWKEIRLTSWGW